MITHVENPILEVHDLTVSYNRKPVLWGVDFTLPKGCIAGILGPNGAGKSTLLKSIMGLIPVASGYVRIFDQPLDEIRQRVAYVPQRESVDWDFPVSVLDVVLMGRYAHLKLFQKSRKQDKMYAMECLEKVGLENYANRQISQLSGGQQQRVFIARSLAQQADFYILDEPFAGVDASTEKSIITLLKEMSSLGKTVLVVHHDLQSAQEYFDWILMINMHLVASGPTSEVLTNENLTKTYGGQLNILSEVGNIIQKKAFPTREK